jgi:hypothetical protein
MPGRPRSRCSGWRRPTTSSLPRRAPSLSGPGRLRRTGGRTGLRICSTRTQCGGWASRPGGGGDGPAARYGRVRGGSFTCGRPGCEDHRVGWRDRSRSDPRECGAAKPYGAGSGTVAAPGEWKLGPGSVGADRGGTAIGRHDGRSDRPVGSWRQVAVDSGHYAQLSPWAVTRRSRGPVRGPGH